VAKIETALITVADKTGVPEFAARLAALDIGILATGGTARLLREEGVAVTDVTDYTGFPEILDGGLRTLHPKVTGGVLARREEEKHLRELEELGIRTIDMVVVNLFPFVDAISAPGLELMRAIENIDVAGPTLVRSAAKNYTHVAVVTNPETYEDIAGELEQNDGSLSEETHFELALEAFRHTAHYDTAIARYLAGIHGEEGTALDRLVLEFLKKQDLRYGENPHQRAALYVEQRVVEASASASEQIAGPPPSLNNMLDLDAGIDLAKEFSRPAAVLVKQRNPCGAAVADCLKTAYENAYLCDPVSAYGCGVVLNRPLNTHAANALVSVEAGSPDAPGEHAVEVLAAPGFDDEALRVLWEKAEWSKRTRIFQTPPMEWSSVDERAQDMRRVTGGLLVQDRDLLGFVEESNRVVTEATPSKEEMADLRFAWLCCKHVRSNAVVLARGEMLVGVGAGQMSRADAAELAVRKAGERAEGAALASDGFLRRADGLELAARAGVRCIIQPGGSEDDAAVIGIADRIGLAMVLTGTRHFRH
jgi:phosphoribosylaminoimidazolecarboxamide formyltransferase/IMP cyclohydrolase